MLERGCSTGFMGRAKGGRDKSTCRLVRCGYLFASAYESMAFHQIFLSGGTRPLPRMQGTPLPQPIICGLCLYPCVLLLASCWLCHQSWDHTNLLRANTQTSFRSVVCKLTAANDTFVSDSPCRWHQTNSTRAQ